MRRLPVYFSDDILMEEIIAMARAHGFHVRHTNGMTVVDRVPGVLRRDDAHEQVVPIRKSQR